MLGHQTSDCTLCLQSQTSQDRCEAAYQTARQGHSLDMGKLMLSESQTRNDVCVRYLWQFLPHWSRLLFHGSAKDLASQGRSQEYRKGVSTCVRVRYFEWIFITSAQNCASFLEWLNHNSVACCNMCCNSPDSSTFASVFRRVITIEERSILLLTSLVNGTWSLSRYDTLQ